MSTPFDVALMRAGRAPTLASPPPAAVSPPSWKSPLCCSAAPTACRRRGRRARGRTAASRRGCGGAGGGGWRGERGSQLGVAIESRGGWRREEARQGVTVVAAGHAWQPLRTFFHMRKAELMLDRERHEMHLAAPRTPPASPSPSSDRRRTATRRGLRYLSTSPEGGPPVAPRRERKHCPHAPRPASRASCPRGRSAAASVLDPPLLKAATMASRPASTPSHEGEYDGPRDGRGIASSREVGSPPTASWRRLAHDERDGDVTPAARPKSTKRAVAVMAAWDAACGLAAVVLRERDVEHVAPQQAVAATRHPVTPSCRPDADGVEAKRAVRPLEEEGHERGTKASRRFLPPAAADAAVVPGQAHAEEVREMNAFLRPTGRCSLRTPRRARGGSRLCRGEDTASHVRAPLGQRGSGRGDSGGSEAWHAGRGAAFEAVEPEALTRPDEVAWTAACASSAARSTARGEGRRHRERVDDCGCLARATAS